MWHGGRESRIQVLSLEQSLNSSTYLPLYQRYNPCATAICLVALKSILCMLCPFTNITGNYISQAPFPPGF